jgi:hypothetical protein
MKFNKYWSAGIGVVDFLLIIVSIALIAPNDKKGWTIISTLALEIIISHFLAGL